VQRRALVWLAGLASLGLGVPLLLSVLARHGTYVSFRYWDSPDLALRLAAALGAAWLAVAVPARLGKLVAPVLAGALLVLAVWPLAPWDADRAAQLCRGQLVSANAAVAIGTLRPLIRQPGIQVVAVPVGQQARVAVELGLPLDQVRDMFLAARAAPLDRALAGTRAVYHDTNSDTPARKFAPLTVTGAARVGTVVVSPMLVDPARGVYVLAVGDASGHRLRNPGPDAGPGQVSRPPSRPSARCSAAGGASR
jgi:hypothetical protein